MIQIDDDMWVNPKHIVSVYHKEEQWRVFTFSTGDKNMWHLVKEKYLDNFLSTMGINR
jgi:hypothetical protein